MRRLLSIALVCFCGGIPLQGQLIAKVRSITRTPGKVVVKIELQNQLSSPVESARAYLFLLDEKGKVQGRKSEWVINATRRPGPLGAGEKRLWHFVLNRADAEFQRVQFGFSRLILEGGRVVDAKSNSRVESSE